MRTFTQKDPSPVAFGFYPLNHPGINMTCSSVFVGIAMTLSVFNTPIERVDENDNVVGTEIRCPDGVVSHPKPCECNTKSRFEKPSYLFQRSNCNHPV